MKKMIFLAFGVSLLLSSCKEEKNENYQVINKDIDGKLSVIDQSKGRIIVINKNNRVNDVVELNLKDDDISKIKLAKEDQDKALKIRSWGNTTITGTKYTLSLSTRYYKDKLLYKLTFSPSDAGTPLKARETQINLRDQNGFIIEKINPYSSWVSVVNENGVAQFEQASGEMPMSLDNYLEISAYDPTWTFK